MYEKPILIVDDEQELLIMIRKIFQRAGFTQIMTAASAEAALKILSVQMPAMAVLDVMMPGMDGFALLKEIRKVSSMPVLMLTAKGEPEDRCTGLELGADDYLAIFAQRAYASGYRNPETCLSGRKPYCRTGSFPGGSGQSRSTKRRRSLSAYCKRIRRISEACRKCRSDRYYWFSLPDCLRRDLAGL